jgi:ribosomal protein S13
MKKSKLIASVVVFKELHDNNKDIYDIIEEFLKAAIITNKLWNFNSTQITALIETEFDFNLPEAVIRTTLKKRLIKSNFLKFENGEYLVNNVDLKVNPEFEVKYETKKTLYKETEDQFISFIQLKREKKLKENEIENIRDNIKQYLLGNGINEEYTQEISSFIVQNKKNKEFQERLNDIKEGLVLYTGIRYTADLNELGKWKNELTIFLDTEILFYFAGFDGDIFKEIFNDFYKLVREINLNSKTKKIKLKYFQETEKDIINFFHVASLIIDGTTSLNPSKTAMKEIVNGCSTKSDIIVKRNKFFIDLKTAGIAIEEDKDYYENCRYNIEGDEVINELKKVSHECKRDFNEEKCKDYLKLFTKINVLRHGANNLGFDKSKYIILTNNRFVHYLAHSIHIKTNEKNIPFATDIDFITDKFWFKLKKGFGNSDDKPKSFEIITKAQIVLSAQINNTVQEKFTALNDKYNSGKITREEAISLNYELRESSLKPEEITVENLDSSIAFINEFSIEEHIREREKLKRKAKEGEEAKNELKRRDLIDRNTIIKPIKVKFKIYGVLSIALLAITFLMIIYFSYVLVAYLKEPDDSKLAIIGFIIGIIVLFPLYKYSKVLFKLIRNNLIKKFKTKIGRIMKQPVPNKVYV